MQDLIWSPALRPHAGDQAIHLRSWWGRGECCHMQAIPSVARCLRPSGRFCGFSPCIEQVQRTAEALRSNGFTDIQCVECLLRHFNVKSEPCLTPHMPKQGKIGEVCKGSETVVGGAEEGAGGAVLAATVVSDEPGGEQSDHGGSGVANRGAGHQVQGGGPEVPGEGHGGVQGQGKKGSKRTRSAALAMSLPDDEGRRLVAVPMMNAKGHTGYLLFARKLVQVDEH
jgi:hypothetical protein